MRRPILAAAVGHASACPIFKGVMVEVADKIMGKRIMLIVVGAGIGSLAGLLVSFLGAGNWALIGGAVLGGVIPPLVLGPPSGPS